MTHCCQNFNSLCKIHAARNNGPRIATSVCVCVKRILRACVKNKIQCLRNHKKVFGKRASIVGLQASVQKSQRCAYEWLPGLNRLTSQVTARFYCNLLQMHGPELGLVNLNPNLQTGSLT